MLTYWCGGRRRDPADSDATEILNIFVLSPVFCWKLVGSGGVAIHVAKIRHFHVDLVMSRPSQGSSRCNGDFGDFSVESGFLLETSRIWWSCNPCCQNSTFPCWPPHVEAVAGIQPMQRRFSGFLCWVRFFCRKLVGFGGVAIHVAKIRHFHVDLLMSRPSQGSSRCNGDFRDICVESGFSLETSRIWWSCNPCCQNSTFPCWPPHVEAVAGIQPMQRRFSGFLCWVRFFVGN